MFEIDTICGIITYINIRVESVNNAPNNETVRIG